MALALGSSWEPAVHGPNRSHLRRIFTRQEAFPRVNDRAKERPQIVNRRKCHRTGTIRERMNSNATAQLTPKLRILRRELPGNGGSRYRRLPRVGTSSLVRVGASPFLCREDIEPSEHRLLDNYDDRHREVSEQSPWGDVLDVPEEIDALNSHRRDSSGGTDDETASAGSRAIGEQHPKGMVLRKFIHLDAGSHQWTLSTTDDSRPIAMARKSRLGSTWSSPAATLSKVPDRAQSTDGQQYSQEKQNARHVHALQDGQTPVLERVSSSLVWLTNSDTNHSTLRLSIIPM